VYRKFYNMNSFTKGYKGIYIYFLVAGVFLIIVSYSLFSDGMFLDGVLYSTMAKNEARGLGTFWQPHMSETIFPVFVNHPPLAFGLESLFFRILGDSRFVERIYSLLTIILTGLIIVMIWKSLGKKSSLGWLPILLWIAIPSVTWATVNNMLENTMGIFICLSVLFYIKSLRSHRVLLIFLSGLMLSFGFLTKGFVTFFPLTFPFFFWLFTRKTTFRHVFIDSSLLLISAVLPLVLVYSLMAEARLVLPEYLRITFDLTVNSATKDSRFFIVNRLFMELLPDIGVILLFLLVCRRKNLSLNQLTENRSLALSFFCLGLSGVLPIMITRVQSGYYLLTSLPFFAISFGLMVLPLVEKIIEKINFRSSGYTLFKLTGITLFLTGICLSAIFSGHINRDQNKIKDMRVIAGIIPENSVVNILPPMCTDWSLHVYYARYRNISLDWDLNNRHGYLLIKNSLYSDTLKNGFKKVSLNTIDYDLYERLRTDTLSRMKN
jgi:4-amino-4-deoxy-L-arabinose transferase-like glycosyltransferase